MAGKQVVEKSSASVYVYSTLANPQNITVYLMPDKNDAAQMGRLPVPVRNVIIKGGAGIASKNLITEQGVCTRITEEEYDAIKDVKHFSQFIESGHFTVERKKYDIDKIVGDMNPRDPGGPITPADYETAPKDGAVPLPVELEKAGSGWVAQQLSNR